MVKELESRINHIQERLDDISSSVHNIDKSLAVQQSDFTDHKQQDEKMYHELKRMNDILQLNTESLKEHMYRTDLLESLVSKMDARLTPIEVERIEKATINKYKEERLERFVKIGKVLGAIVSLLTVVTMLKSCHLI